MLFSPLKISVFPAVAWKGGCQDFFCSSSHGVFAQVQLFPPEAADGTFQPLYLAASQSKHHVRKKPTFLIENKSYYNYESSWQTGVLEENSSVLYFQIDTMTADWGLERIQ